MSSVVADERLFEATAYALNDAGQVVGSSTLAVGDTVTRRAFVWDRTLGMRQLGTLGGRSDEAVAVNTHGQIVGISETPALETHAVLWEVPPPGRVDLVISGGISYGTGGPLRSGDITVQRRTDGSVVRVIGSGELAGGVHVAVDVRQVWVLSLYVGYVHLDDPDAGLRLRTPVVSGRLTRSGQAVGATSTWVDTSRWPWVPYRLTWTVADSND